MIETTTSSSMSVNAPRSSARRLTSLSSVAAPFVFAMLVMTTYLRPAHLGL